MNDQRPYRILPHGASRLKRKERESSFPPANRPPPPPPRATVPASTATAATKPATGSKGIDTMTSSNKLIAGCMAYEFLTKGTLLGHKFDTDRSETAAMINGKDRYEQITSLLMMKTEGGDRVSGIVNPTQLRRWIEM